MLKTGCAKAGAAMRATARMAAVFMDDNGYRYVRSDAMKVVGDAQSVAVGRFDSLSCNSRKELEVKLDCKT